MLNKGLRLYKREKLCSTTAIDNLFAAGRGFKPASGEPVFNAMAYPWRAVWTENTHRSADNPQFLVSVPKKRLKHAVDRVAMRRRCREAYRLSRHLIDADKRVDIAFIYVGNGLTPYARTLRSVQKILGRISETLSSSPDNGTTDTADN